MNPNGAIIADIMLSHLRSKGRVCALTDMIGYALRWLMMVRSRELLRSSITFLSCSYMPAMAWSGSYLKKTRIQLGACFRL